MNKCKDCRWWLKGTGCAGGDGYCQRHAPLTRLLVTTDKYFTHYGMWPQVHGDRFCGDFEVKDESANEERSQD